MCDNMEFDEKGNIIKEGGVISMKVVPTTKIKKGKKFERSYFKLDPRG